LKFSFTDALLAFPVACSDPPFPLQYILFDEAEAGSAEEQPVRNNLLGITGVVKPNASPQCSCWAL